MRSWVVAAARIVSTAVRGFRTAARRHCGSSCARGSGPYPVRPTPHCDGNRERRHHDDGGSRHPVRDAFAPAEIGRAHVCTPVTNAHLVCRLLLEKTKLITTI